MRNLIWIVVAAIIAIGGYMLWSGKSPTELANDATTAAGEAADAAGDAVDAVAETAGDAVDAARDAAEGAADPRDFPLNQPGLKRI